MLVLALGAGMALDGMHALSAWHVALGIVGGVFALSGWRSWKALRH
jgi:hypothetical protein